MAAQTSAPRRWLWFTVRGLVAVAFGIAAYLAWHAVTGGRPIGCGPESGCDRVLHSRWAYWFGVPVSVFSLGVYAVIFAASFRVRPPATPVQQARSWRALVPCAVAVLGAALWFVAVQAMVLHSFCRFCMAAHVCGALASALILWAAPFRSLPASGRKESAPGVLPPFTAGKLALLGGAAVGVLALGQMVHQPKTFAVTAIPSGTNVGPSAAAVSPMARPFSFYDGRFTVDLNDVPVIGSPANPRVIVSLFDYTCHHCQIMHGVLREVQTLFSNDLVIASLPMPLAPGCNSLVKALHPDHVQACDYARLGLAVWRADRAKHAEFDDWLFASNRPPAVTQAVLRAEQLVGAEALNRARQDPWIEAQLKANVAVYESAYRAGQGSMPQLIVGSNVAVGTFPRYELLSLLERNLGLRRAP